MTGGQRGADAQATWLIGCLATGSAPPAGELDARISPARLAMGDTSQWQSALEAIAPSLRGATVFRVEVEHQYLVRWILQTQAGPLVRLAVRASDDGSLTMISFSPPFRAVRWTDHYLVTPDGELRVRDYGGDGDAVVLLHCGMADVSHWDWAARQLPGRRLAFDLRGHGHWPAEVGFRPMAVANDLRLVVETFDIEPPAVVGHSLGGWAAVACASSGAPLSRLVTLDGPNALGPPTGLATPPDAPDWLAMHSCAEPLGTRDQIESVGVPWLAIMCRADDGKNGDRRQVESLVMQTTAPEVVWVDVAHQAVVTHPEALATTARFLS